MPLPFHLVAAFVGGAVIGSFLNVVIYRLPREESLVSPPSHCPHCDRAIPPWHNVPIVSWFVLGGRCRFCREKISPRYPLGEAANAVLYLLLMLRFGPGVPFFIWAAYGSALLVVTGIDLDHQLIPDVITFPGMLVGLLASLVLPLSFLESLAALLAGGGFFYAVAYLSDKILGKPGMGGGDIKLTAMMGAFLGLQSLAVAVFTALLTGSAISLLLIATGRKTRKDVIPFGPFLALGGIIALFWGPSIVDWYLEVSSFI